MNGIKMDNTAMDMNIKGMISNIIRIFNIDTRNIIVKFTIRNLCWHEIFIIIQNLMDIYILNLCII